MKLPSVKKQKSAKQSKLAPHLKGQVAIVGIGCRFPGAHDYTQFWDNLAGSVNSIREITPDRWDINQHYSPDRDAFNKSISKWGGLMDRVDFFDAPFFYISPREAQSMDPQQRMLLEETWHCIEDAGISPLELHEKRTAVYVGVMATDYYQHAAKLDHQIDGYSCLGNYEGILSNRLSYFFDLTGESQSLDAACASSLVALHHARRSLLHGESDYAIAAGVNVICHPWKYISFSKANMLSPEGQCKTFDEEADGYVPGEGIGVLLLETLENAIEKGHHVYGILKGSAVHHNGKTKSLTAPQVEAQRRVIEEAHSSSEVLSESITYVEAHGTGTSLGDPIEVEALTKAFNTSHKQYCYIGSVKTNIGHLEGAAGIAGVIKVLMMMKNKKIPQTLNLKTVNPIIDFENSPFRLAEQFTDWILPETVSTRCAGVSSFGFGGISSHVILEEYQSAKCSNEDVILDIPLPFILSAKSDEALVQLLKKWQSYVDTEDFKSQSLRNICYTLAKGRNVFPYRFGLMVRSKEELIQALKEHNYNAHDFLDTKIAFSKKSIVLCLHPITTLRYSKFHDVCKQFPILSQLEAECEQIISQFINPKEKLNTLYDDNNEQFEPFKHFIMQYIISKALLFSGLHPHCLMADGDSELVEAVISCMLDFDIAVQSILGMHPDIQLKRPQISFYDMQNKKMIRHYKISASYCKALVDGIDIDVAAKEIIFHKSRQLNVNQYTFKKLLAQWGDHLIKYQLDITKILASTDEPLTKNQEQLVLIILLFCMKKLNEKWDLSATVAVSNVNTIEIMDLLLDKVLDEEKVVTLFLDPNPINLEAIAAHIQKNQNNIDPGKPYTLLNQFSLKVEEIPDVNQWFDAILKGDVQVVDKIPVDIKFPLYIDISEKKYHRDEGNISLAINNLKTDLPLFLMDLWKKNVLIDWGLWYFSADCQLEPLPVYPFDKEYYWIEESVLTTHIQIEQDEPSLQPLLDAKKSNTNVSHFTKALTKQAFYLKDHRVHHVEVLPAAAYLEMVGAAARLTSQNDSLISLRNILWISPIRVAEQPENVTISIYLNQTDTTFEVSTEDNLSGAGKQLHAQGKIVFESMESDNKPRVLDILLLKSRCTKQTSSKEIYEQFNRIGLNYGPSFQVILDCWSNDSEILSRIELPKHLINAKSSFFLHPSMMDGALQTALNILHNKSDLYLPFSISQVDLLDPLPSVCYVYATKVPGSEERSLPKFNLQITNEEGKVLTDVKDLTVRQLRNEEEKALTHYYRSQWVQQVSDSSADISGVTLVFDNEGQFVHELRNRLPDQLIINVKYGDSYQVIDSTNYQIDKNHFIDYATLLNLLVEKSSLPTQIIYLTNSHQLTYYSDELIKKELHNTFFSLFYLVQALIAIKPKDVIQVLCVNQKSSLFTNPLSGFAKTLHLEHPKINCKIIDTPNSIDDVLRELNSQDIEVRYDNQLNRWIKRYIEKEQVDELKKSEINKSHVYLITGGAGGLGLIFAKYFAEHYQAKLVLTGRSELNAKQKLKIAELENLGSEVMYVRSDVTKQNDVEHLIRTIKERFGGLNGILHAAGALRDAFILKKTTQDITEVLAPKINGTLYLNEMTQAEPLEFFILFSSMVSVLGNVGQSDYAYGNGFMDAFAEYRNQQQHQGKTVAINWPLWAEGGMQVDESSLQWMETTFGVVPLSITDGIHALFDALARQDAQQIVLVGKRQKLNEALHKKTIKIFPPVIETNVSQKPTISPNNSANLKQKTEAYLKIVLSQAINLAPERINASHSFEQYGIDSLMIVNLNRLLDKDFDDLPKTLFFEYLSLDELTDYFVENHADLLAKKLTPSEDPVAEESHEPILKPPIVPSNENIIEATTQITSQVSSQDIAIIGMSGRYPQARDLEIFWNNLKSGKDSVTEIPKERWDYHLDFDSDKTKDGKSYSKWGGFIDDVDKFDPLFFGISPHEAELMDPQERLFLETSWNAIEDAGYTRKMLSPSQVGVFVGVMYGEYQLFGAQESVKGHVMSTNPLYAYIANRVSYYFDFHGPSIALDTMCSSSLTSVHLACQSIRNKECQLAVAGGVNISIHPNKYIFLSRGKFLASDGRCRSFGEGGDGYVPGEGVGAILLKPLHAALADGDHIYGIIKGTSVNHGGKTNGFTVPNPKAQAALLDLAFKDANIQPDSISYIEAHGTGTSLGDPIEITGLSKAFGRDARQTSYAIGSVKSNIGHLESAAGIAAITKVLLQMQHKMLVPSLHSETLNPNINWAGIPFKVQHELAEWKRLLIDNEAKNEVPRRATISSFGAGGANACMIIEEAPDINPLVTSSKPAYLFCLSAKTDKALKQKLLDLSVWLLKHDNLPLSDVSYTLNVGRTHFDVRIVLIASSFAELKELLALVNTNQITPNYLSNIGIDTLSKDPILDDLLVKIQDELSQETSPELYRKKLMSLGDLYVKGIDIDWMGLHEGESKKKMSLPTYPFTNERYWIPVAEESIGVEPVEMIVRLHPLLDANVSTFQQQCFTKRFMGNEFYLEDHCIHGQFLLPGAVYLEMAKIAGALAAPGYHVVGLKDIVWMKSIRVSDHPENVELSLTPQGEDTFFEVKTVENDELNAQGKIIYALEGQVLSEPPSIDILGFKNRCAKKYTQDEIYSLFSTMGFEYGPRLQGIEEYSSNTTQAIAFIRLPKQLEPNANQFDLHPSLLDSILQAVLGLHKNDRRYVPFSLTQFDIYGSLPQTCYACVTMLPAADTSHLVSFQITVTDETGNVLLVIHNLTLRVIEPQKDVYYYKPIWEQLVPLSNTAAQMKGPILVLDDDGQLVQLLQNKFPQEIVLSVKSGGFYQVNNEKAYQLNPNNPDDYVALFKDLSEKNRLPTAIFYRQSLVEPVDIDEQLQRHYYSPFYLVQALIKQKYKGNINLFCVNETPSAFAEAFSGFAKTIHLECPTLTCRLIDVTHLNDVLHELNGPDIEVRYDTDHVRWVKRYKEITTTQEKSQQAVLKKNGVYLITGGMGGLGLIFATYLAEHYQANLILSGRSALLGKQQVIIDQLQALGANVMYVQSDVSKLADAQQLVQQVKERFGVLNGIIHSAGVLRDAFILKKTALESAEVLSPKIYGTTYLDEATKNESLDFLMLFSSVTAFFGNVGQCDYAYGNTFVDAFAKQREQLRQQNKRSGKTISINWPLWKEGGMHVDKASEQWLEKTFGIVALSTASGIKAFTDSLLLDTEQLMVLPGQKKALEQILQGKASTLATQDVPQQVEEQIDQTDQSQLREKTEEYIKTLVSEIIKLAPANINIKESFENYGIDSVMIMKLNQKLEQGFGDLPKTLFFEYLTLKALSDYFIDNHKDALAVKFSLTKAPAVNAQPVAEPEAKQSSMTLPAHRFAQSPIKKTIAFDKHEEVAISNDIAIVGMSGQYPQANTLEVFWDNLKAGKDSVVEIPKARWDNDLYFDPEKDKPGKTYGKWGGFIDDVDKFDPYFFNISVREAQLMDPQERLFLQIAWKAIEDAGYTKDSLANKQVGVFVGAMFDQYQLFGAEESLKRDVLVTNSVASYIANRVSYYLDFHGPSITVDTMCSSSLTSIHLACDNLRLGRCQVALAGGVNVSIHPNKYILLSQGNFLATDGRCRSFGEGGDGYVPAEGVGAVLLKPLHDALADGDHIYGVIKGSSVNHGGKTNGLTVPNPVLQAALIEAAFKDAKINPSTISYIETHGTGTALGDPIEMAGLIKTFGAQKRETPYVIGSVKSNIGHAESAAGIAAVTKVLLQMQHQALVPSLHSEKLNPNINWKEIPFRVQHLFSEWKRLGISDNGVEIPRRASISSFGAGGSNALLIIEEAPDNKTPLSTRLKPAYLVSLSAKTDEALKEKMTDLIQWLDKRNNDLSLEEIALEDISYTLNSGRTHFEKRCAFVVTSLATLRETLVNISSGQTLSNGFIGQSKNDHDFAIFKKVFKQLMLDINQVQAKDYADNLLALANFYVDGYEIDWQRLHDGERKQRISLPTYPFAKLRCWIDVAPTTPPTFHAPEPSPNLPELVLSDVKIDIQLTSDDDLQHFALHYLQGLFSDILKYPIEQLAPDKTYEVFGIDSVTGLTLQKKMEHDFGPLSPTLLYEQNRLQDLSHYLLTHHKLILNKLSGNTQGYSEVQSPSPVVRAALPETLPISLVDSDEDIAIIGISGKYPESEDLSAFWDNLENGRDCVTRVPENRWRPEDYPIKTAKGTRYYDQGGFLKDVDKFDPLFFNIPPVEASIFMDPQERLFLQTAWSVIEDAGYTRAKLEQKVNNNVGVFVGVSFHYYPLYLAEEWFKGNRLPLDIQFYSVANRVSYFFNFNGPSLPIDTACSSSLSAIHLACESIKRGECLMAIAGGVNLSLHPAKYYMLGSTGFMSEQGRCTSFGADGTGYVPAEGVGAILLKPLRLALADKDHIYGVIKTSSMNHGGKTSGMTVPNPNAQAALISTALAKSGIDPRTINYMEAHGTGTSLGDPIEIKGLQSAFEQYTQDKQYCAIGSVKSNIGHAEAAAGISQISKILLQMQHRKLVPSLHASTLNPYINFEQTPFYVQRELSEWKSVGAPRRAGVSSFGAGGANAFLLIEESPVAPIISDSDGSVSASIFVLSAYDADVLYRYVKSFHQFLTQEQPRLNTRVKDICYSVQVGREAMPARLALVVTNYSELLAKLNQYLQQPEQFIKAGWANAAAIQSTQSATLTEYESLAKQWVAGMQVSWENLYTQKSPDLIPLLPTYPFVKRRCWVPGNDAFADKPTIQAPSETVGVAETMQEWLYSTTWIPSSINDMALIEEDTGYWLVFGDDRLSPLGNKKTIQCQMGERFIAHGVHDFSINPDDLADYQQLFAEVIDKQQIKLAGILYLWPTLFTHKEDASFINETTDRLLLITQALTALSLSNKPKLCIVTHGGQVVLPTDNVQIAQHPLWAFANIFAMEAQNYVIRLVDLDGQIKIDEQMEWLHRFLITKTSEMHVAFRQGTGYVLRLTHQINQDINAFVMPRAALVSGGLGALGLEISNWLIEQGTTYLLLIGSTVLPPRTEWSKVTDLKLKSKIDGLQSLEAKGAIIYYLAANITDKEKIEQALMDCETKWKHSIEGVFHLAGVTTDSIPVEKMTTDLLHEVLSPKIQGTLVLHELFKSKPLKCFVLFSSVSAVPYSGISGLSAYAAANAFLEGFASFRQRLGLPSLCIEWTAWAEKGMSVQYHQDKFLDAIGISALPIAYGLEILAYLLSTSLSHVIVQKVDWNKFMQVNANLKREPFFEHFSQSQLSQSKTSYRDVDEIVAIVSKLFLDMMQLERSELDLKKPFQNYGLDSVNGIQFILNLNQDFPDTLAQTDLYRYVTIEQLADYIYSHYQQNVEEDITDTDDDLQLKEEISALNEDEASALLEKELREIEDDETF